MVLADACAVLAEGFFPAIQLLLYVLDWMPFPNMLPPSS
jgi:hypothetical protein